ncbi:FAD-dependent oxidoreductase [Microbacterium sp. P03]|uniref:FAD-dependent oxidoreductase n=1 Tax=Microbacterium sp. P03 TaxID=3366946 RepID=UPI0037452686
MEQHDVIVIGAGLAGLRCATRLAQEGLDVVVLEAADVVGGRERTDDVDGFRLDLGFHVLNPAYPAVRRWVDVDALRMRRFPVGVRVRREQGGRGSGHGVGVLGHPLRHPSLILPTLRSGLVSPADLTAVTRWAVPVLLSPRRVIDGQDETLREGWDRAGLTGSLRAEVLEPFLAGVIADDTGTTSDVFVKLLVRMFALGRPGLPARGIGALPVQLAAAATDAGADIRLRQTVTALTRRATHTEVHVAHADTVRARAAVVAVGPGVVADLVDIPAPVTKGLQTWWFDADAGAAASALISVDGRRAGPIVNTAVMSRTLPSYAPAGRDLVQATCLLPWAARTDARAAPREADVRRQLGEIWGTDAATWRLIRRDDIHDALPAQTAPLRTTSAARIDDRIYVAGDHRDTASIQGALVSGERIARAVRADLRGD